MQHQNYKLCQSWTAVGFKGCGLIRSRPLLQSWKINYLNDYVDRLIRLSSNNTLREELAAFPLARDAHDKLPVECRPGISRLSS